MRKLKEPYTYDFYFTDLGYKFASGKKGTGWIAVDEYYIKELEKEYGKKIQDMTEEEIEQYVDGWTETEQFDYEVFSKYIQPLMDKYKDEEDKRELLGTALIHWVYGYTNYIMNLFDLYNK